MIKKTFGLKNFGLNIVATFESDDGLVFNGLWNLAH